MGSRRVDAVVIGAGPNGLTAANVLTDLGWDVLVLEAQPEPGGAVRSAEAVEAGFVNDRFSAFYPLAAVSPHIRALGLERHGLRWTHAPSVLANPLVDGPAIVLDRDRAKTAASLERHGSGDGQAWLDLQGEWERLQPNLIEALLDPFPPVRAACRLAPKLGVRGTVEFLRRALLPVQRLGEETFSGTGGPLLLAGCALHADVTPQASAGGFLGWMLAGIGQQHGWPVPEGGSGQLTAAMVERFRAGGGDLECDRPVVRIEVGGGRARAVHTADGERIAARRAILADVVAPVLYRDLVDEQAVPARLFDDLARYQRGAATFKVNWTIDGAIPWTDPTVARAGTVHVTRSVDELTMNAAQLAIDQLPDQPFCLVGQMSVADPTRSLPGTQSVWAYTSVPQHPRADAAGELDGVSRPEDVERFADRIQDRIEAFAPGFMSGIRRREVQSPGAIQRDDANLLNGDKSLGSAQLHQQLVFRPTVGLARTETPIAGLFLASASAHPGGGVHGACGANAARAAHWADRRRRLLALGRRGGARAGG